MNAFNPEKQYKDKQYTPAFPMCKTVLCTYSVSVTSHFTDLAGGWSYTTGVDLPQLDISEHRQVPGPHWQGFG